MNDVDFLTIRCLREHVQVLEDALKQTEKAYRHTIQERDGWRTRARAAEAAFRHQDILNTAMAEVA